jgi:hypothetical protein
MVLPKGCLMDQRKGFSKDYWKDLKMVIPTEYFPKGCRMDPEMVFPRDC